MANLTVRSRTLALLRRITNYRIVLACIGVGGVGAMVLWYSSDTARWRKNVAGQAFFAQLGGVLIAAVALYIVWELAAKRSFSREVLAAAGLGSQVEESGLLWISDDYQGVDWDELFRNVTNLDLFFAYAQGWRSANDARLKRMLDRPGTRLRVYLADPADSEQLNALALRFRTTVERLKIKIDEAAEDYRELGQVRPGVVEIYHRQDAYLFAAYKFDDTIVVTMYSHTRERTGVPTFIFRKPGSLYRFFEREFMFFGQREL